MGLSSLSPGHVKTIETCLKEMSPNARPVPPITMQDAVKRLYSVIMSLKDSGVTYEAISEKITELGVPMSAHSLVAMLKRQRIKDAKAEEDAAAVKEMEVEARRRAPKVATSSRSAQPSAQPSARASARRDAEQPQKAAPAKAGKASATPPAASSRTSPSKSASPAAPAGRAAPAPKASPVAKAAAASKASVVPKAAPKASPGPKTSAASKVVHAARARAVETKPAKRVNRAA